MFLAQSLPAPPLKATWNSVYISYYSINWRKIYIIYAPKRQKMNHLQNFFLLPAFQLVTWSKRLVSRVGSMNRIRTSFRVNRIDEFVSWYKSHAKLFGKKSKKSLSPFGHSTMAGLARRETAGNGATPHPKGTKISSSRNLVWVSAYLILCGFMFAQKTYDSAVCVLNPLWNTGNILVKYWGQ